MLSAAATFRVARGGGCAPPAALGLRSVPKIVVGLGIDGAGAGPERNKRGAQHGVVRWPGQSLGDFAAKLVRQAKQHIGHRTRVVQGQNGGRRETGHRLQRARLGHAVEPGLERSVVGQDQVGLGAGLVNEAAEADDVWNFGEGLADAQAWRRGENRIGLVEQQHLRRVRLTRER